MATTFSPVSHIRSICYASDSPRTRLSFPGSGNVGYWSASANYVKLRVAARGFSVKQLVVKQPWKKRQVQMGVFRCATIEEIEAEKSMIEKDVKERMEKTIENVRSSFNSIRTGRANPAILDKVEVDYYGTPVILKSIAQISSPDASSLLVQPYDKSRLLLELSKIVAKQAEEGKVAIRNIRRDAIKSYEKLEKEKKLSEDNVKDLSSDLQKVTDDYMKKIDSIYKQKEKELLTV
ncbi:UNVERIFIED_CONTAM: Ribosome-recycling factor, chloroplastic [Sesamum angustifolium]|uniref:Ribosome-recycling factor, chloroplastic n=1 Tax=Sesamum angustifolium TaxID=2727405 RepID=A0AAW2QTJ4_9LAMI